MEIFYLVNSASVIRSSSSFFRITSSTKSTKKFRGAKKKTKKKQNVFHNMQLPILSFNYVTFVIIYIYYVIVDLCSMINNERRRSGAQFSPE